MKRSSLVLLLVVIGFLIYGLLGKSIRNIEVAVPIGLVFAAAVFFVGKKALKPSNKESVQSTAKEVKQ